MCSLRWAAVVPILYCMIGSSTQISDPLSPPPSRSEEARRSYEEGQKAYRDRKFEKAEGLARSAIRLDGANPLYYDLLGNVFDDTGRYDEAIAQYDIAIKLDPRYAEAYADKGNSLYKQEKADAALENYRKCIELKPDYLPAQRMVAQILTSRGDWSGALPALTQMARIEPQNFDWQMNLANAYLKLNRPQEAQAPARRALFLKPSSSQAHYLVGLSLGAAGDVTGAIAQWREAIRYDRNFAPAHANLGSDLLRSGQAQAAVAALRTALSLPVRPEWTDFDVAGVRVVLAGALADSGEREQAIQEYESIILQFPQAGAAFLGLALQLHPLKRYQEAAEALRKAVELLPASARAAYNLAFILEELHDREGAIAMYREAVRRESTYVAARENLANLLDDAGQHEEAIAEYRAAIAMQPEKVSLHYNLGIALERANDPDQALSALGEAIQRDPSGKLGYGLDARLARLRVLTTAQRWSQIASEAPGVLAMAPQSAYAHFALGRALEQAGDEAGAIRHYQACVQSEPDRPEGNFYLGRLLHDRGAYDEAMQYLKRACELSPQSQIYCDRYKRVLSEAARP